MFIETELSKQRKCVTVLSYEIITSVIGVIFLYSIFHFELVCFKNKSSSESFKLLNILSLYLSLVKKKKKIISQQLRSIKTEISLVHAASINFGGVHKSHKSRDHQSVI